MKYGNIIYFGRLNTIGGIETWLYYLSELYKDLDITVIVNKASQPQLQRLSKNFRVILWNGKDRFECKHLFVCFNTNILPFIDAEKTSLVLHGDYEDMLNRGQLNRDSLPIHPKVDEYIGITKHVCESWERLTGIKATLCYNPVIPPRKHKVIRLCSAQRMSKEKGRNRIKLLANALDRYSNITGDKWIWDIYTDDKDVIYQQNIHYISSRLDIVEYFKAYDWFVALSDNEGYCYSVVENLIRGVPCVVTDLPVFKEIGLNENNSLILKMNLSNIFEIAKGIFNKQLEFEYEPPKDNWGFLFEDIKTTYQYKEVSKMLHKVRALDTYRKLNVKDAVVDEILPVGFEFEVDDERLKILLGNNKYKAQFVEVVKEAVNEEPVEENNEETVEEKKPTKRKKK